MEPRQGVCELGKRGDGGPPNSHVVVPKDDQTREVDVGPLFYWALSGVERSNSQHTSKVLFSPKKR